MTPLDGKATYQARRKRGSRINITALQRSGNSRLRRLLPPAELLAFGVLGHVQALRVR